MRALSIPDRYKRLGNSQQLVFRYVRGADRDTYRSKSTSTAVAVAVKLLRIKRKRAQTAPSRSLGIAKSHRAEIAYPLTTFLEDLDH